MAASRWTFLANPITAFILVICLTFGKPVSWLKVFLYATTGITSLCAWGFNAFGEAFLIMNLFHAVQYFGIVWAREGPQMTRRLRLENASYGRGLTLLLFLGVTGAYGFWVEAVDTEVRHLWAITLVVSIMHFWYDGFIWSVRKQQT